MRRSIPIVLASSMVFSATATNVNTVVAEDIGIREATNESELKTLLNDSSVKEVKLTKDISVVNSITIGNTADVVLDLNGHKITTNGKTYLFVNNGKLTIKDSMQNGRIETRGIDNYGEINLESGTVVAIGDGGGAAIYNQNIFNMTGGELKSIGNYNPDKNTYPICLASAFDEAVGKIPVNNIQGGNLEAKNLAIHVIKGTLDIEKTKVKIIEGGNHAIKIGKDGKNAKDDTVKAVIKNVEINTTGGAGGIYVAGGIADVYDTTVNATGTEENSHNNSVLAVSQEGTLNVHSGTYSGEKYGAYVFSTGGTINIDRIGLEKSYTIEEGKQRIITDETVDSPVKLSAPTSLILSRNDDTISSVINLKADPDIKVATNETELRVLLNDTSIKEVRIANDIAVTSRITIGANATPVLNLNGHKISTNGNTYVFKNDGKLTIKDTGENGRIETRGIDNYGEVNLESGTVVAIGDGGGAAIYNQNIFNMTGGELKATGNYNPDKNTYPICLASAFDEAVGKIPVNNIQGGNLEAKNLAIHVVKGTIDIEKTKVKIIEGGNHAIKIGKDGKNAKDDTVKAVIKNVEINTTGGAGGIYVAGGIADVYDTTVNATGTEENSHNNSVLAVSQEGTLNVHSGTYSGEKYGAYVFSTGGTINILRDGEVKSYTIEEGKERIITGESVDSPVKLSAPTLLILSRNDDTISSVINLKKSFENTENPGNEDPGNEDPGNENPGTEDPGNENPGTEDPGNENPGTEDPGNEDPGNENPGTENPGNENPGTENPGTENPGTENPGNENPGNEISKFNERIAGKDRLETAIKVSQKLYPKGAKVVILANKDQATDVLSAVPFSVQVGAPILFTNTNSLPSKIMNEIKRLGANEVYISGGTKSVSKSIEDQLKKSGKKVTRLSGKDRYDTAIVIGEKVREKGNKNTVEVASGESFPDALSLSALAKKHNAPILLVKKDDLTKSTKDALSKWGIQNVTIAGQTGTISKKVENEIKKVAKNTTRLGGANRYETSTLIAKAAAPNSTLGVYTSGEVFADALVAGTFAGVNDAPVILVNKNKIPMSVDSFTKKSKINKFVVIGGVSTVQDSTFNKIKEILNIK